MGGPFLRLFMYINYVQHLTPVKDSCTVTFRKATDLLAVPLKDVAKATGRSYDTVLAYRTGARKPPPEVLASLASFMRAHSSELVAAAKELEQMRRSIRNQESCSLSMTRSASST